MCLLIRIVIINITFRNFKIKETNGGCIECIDYGAKMNIYEEPNKTQNFFAMPVWKNASHHCDLMRS